MDRGFEHSSEKLLICVLSVLVVISLLFCTAAEAYIYDDFNSFGIDTGKWTISNPPYLFSQPGDGQLYFNSDNTAGVSPAPSGSLRSTTSFTAGFFSLDFCHFSSSNTSPANQGLGSFAALGLGTKTSYVRMLRGRVVSPAGGYFEANYFDGTLLHVWYVSTDVTSGQLGLYYDGSTVSFFYNNGSDGWQRLDTTGPDTNRRTVTVTPGWSSPQPLFISGTPGGSGVTSFEVDKVEYTPGPNPPTALILYDDFSGTYIDKSKWLEGEWVREVDSTTERLLMTQASPSPVSISGYPYSNSNNLDFSDPNSVNSIQADATILQNNVTNQGLTRVRIAGRWYNGRTSDPDTIGDIHAEVALRGGPTGLFARWGVARCTSANCGTTSSLGGGNFTTPINAGTAYTLYINYDVTTTLFTFKVGAEEKFFAGPERVGDANNPWKALGTRVEVDDSTSSAFVSSSFGNVYKNGSTPPSPPYDDFSSPIIDSTKWTTYEFVEEISEGKLWSGIRSSSASDSHIYNRLMFVDPSSINVFQAEVTPLAYENNQGVVGTIARIAGHYYNDGTTGGGHFGLVGGSVSIGGTGVNPVGHWEVFKYNDFDGDPNNVTSIAGGDFNRTISLGNTYTLSLGWNGFQFIFKFDDEVAYYTPAGRIYPPNLPWKELGTRLLNPAGREAIIEALFDNVMVTPIFSTYTPSGSNIRVSPPGSGTTITFPSISSPGNTSVTICSSGPMPPAGFQVGNPPTYYDISTTAVYTPPVAVCITYNPSQYMNPSTARFFHYENGTWVDITASNDLGTHTICGEVNSLSPFAIFEATTYTVTASVAGDPAGGSVSPPSQTISYGGTATFTVTTNTGYTAAVSEGTLSGSTWTIPNVTSSHTVTVTMIDNTPPSITGVSVNPNVLWPPNHKMVAVTVNYNATDNSGQTACQISSVTCNEPISSSDYTIVDAHHVKLSADRSGSGNGRIYTINITCRDASGNSSNQAVTVTVPHDQGK